MVFLCHNFLMNDVSQDKDRIRKILKGQRLQLSDESQKKKSAKIINQVSNTEAFKNAQNIAFYHSVYGEAKPESLLDIPSKANKQFYLPILASNKNQGLHFVAINSETQYENNKFSIPEPQYKETDIIDLVDLDLVIMPLLGFDRLGNRLGMGGGYYDRCFSFKSKKTTKPILMGFAYDFQEVETLTAEPWDVLLDLIATESELIETFAYINK